MAHRANPVHPPLQQERRPHFPHEVGAVIGRRPVHPQTHRDPRRLQRANLTGAGGEQLVAARAMRDPHPRPAEAPHVGSAEMDAMREPGARPHPAALFQVIQRRAAEPRLAERRLILRLGQMRVQPHVPTPRQIGRFLHQLLCDRERRAWRQRHLQHGMRRRVMQEIDQADAVGQDGIHVLHDAVGRQPAIPLRQVHGAAREQRADAQACRRRRLNLDGVLEPGGKHVVMVRGGGAAGQQQFRHRDRDGCVQRRGREAGPDRVERPEPAEQRAVERGGQASREGLEEMMVRVDEPRDHDVPAGIEHRGRGGRGAADRQQFCDDATLHHHAAGRVGMDGQRVADPERLGDHAPMA